MEAPSEKHLEDWIARDIRCLGVWDEVHCNEPMFPLFGRQVDLPSGKCDLLSLNYSFSGSPMKCVCPIEIKKGAADLKALAQLLRYMGDVRYIWRYAMAGLPDTETPNIGGFYVFEEPSVFGILVGSNATDEVIIAAHSAGVEVITYEWDGTAYQFEFSESKRYSRCTYIRYAEYPIGRHIRDVYIENTEMRYGKSIEEIAKEYTANPTIEDYTRWHCGEGQS